MTQPEYTRELVIQESGAASLLRAAIEKGIDAEGIKTLAGVYKDMEAMRAEREFNQDLVSFQHECPVILKKKEIQFPTKSGGTFNSRYAEMDSIIDDTRELRHKYGFSHSFGHEVTDKQVTAICVLRHRGGYQTRTPFTVPIPRDAKISEAHAVAGAVTFCERYAFRGALGITTGTDRDGKEFAEAGATIGEGDQQVLQKLIDEVKPDMAAFWKYANAATLAEIRCADLNKVRAALLQKRKGVGNEHSEARHATY